uniref:Uncharacterized protein n=1 Tax=uncultured marine virus TaxID=186617 RepID=A0A0F7L9J1_9VIRU|nr:hypothetical protein [uncultured marine virus]
MASVSQMAVCPGGQKSLQSRDIPLQTLSHCHLGLSALIHEISARPCSLESLA